MLKLTEPPAGSTSRRRHGRVRCEQTRCTLGSVLDLSASGMRVLIKGRPRFRAGEVASMQVEIDGGALVLMAKVVWLNKVSWRRHVAGLEFVDVEPELRQRLVELARTASNNEYIRDGLDPVARSA